MGDSPCQLGARDTRGCDSSSPLSPAAGAPSLLVRGARLPHDRVLEHLADVGALLHEHLDRLLEERLGRQHARAWRVQARGAGWRGAAEATGGLQAAARQAGRGPVQPAAVLSTEKMKWSLTRLSCTRFSQSLARAHSRHIVHARGRATRAAGTPPASSASKPLSGPTCATSCASAPVTGAGIVTSGSRRYEAVATGDHLACVLPTPFSHHASSSISCGGRHRRRRHGRLRARAAGMGAWGHRR